MNADAEFAVIAELPRVITGAGAGAGIGGIEAMDADGLLMVFAGDGSFEDEVVGSTKCEAGLTTADGLLSEAGSLEVDEDLGSTVLDSVEETTTLDVGGSTPFALLDVVDWVLFALGVEVGVVDVGVVEVI